MSFAPELLSKEGDDDEYVEVTRSVLSFRRINKVAYPQVTRAPQAPKRLKATAFSTKSSFPFFHHLYSVLGFYTMTTHPEVLWAQRSSADEEEKVRVWRKRWKMTQTD